MTLQQLYLILCARWRLSALAMLIVVVVTLIVSLVLPPSYAASTSLLIDAKSVDPLSGSILPAQLLPGYMATQVDIISSERVARKVVGLLGLDKSAQMHQQWREATDGEGTLTAWLGEQLQEQLEVEPSRDSSVITISYEGAEPALSAAVANAFADAYIDTTIELKVEPAREYASWFEERIGSLRGQLELAQQTLSDFQQEQGIVVTDERLDMELTKLAELNSQLAQARSERVLLASRSSQSGVAETLPEVLQNPLISSLRAELARHEAEIGPLASRLGSRHPQYLEARAQLDTLRQRLGKEIERVVSSIGTAEKINSRRETDIQAEVDAQKEKVLALRADRDRIAVLQRDVESAQQAYDLVAQRLTQANLESQSQQTNVAVLLRADPPLEPSSPNIPLNLLLALVMGGAIGVSAPLLAELLNRRVRGVHDLLPQHGLPVLGVIDSSPRRGIPAGI